MNYGNHQMFIRAFRISDIWLKSYYTIAYILAMGAVTWSTLSEAVLVDLASRSSMERVANSLAMAMAWSSVRWSDADIGFTYNQVINLIHSFHYHFFFNLFELQGIQRTLMSAQVSTFRNLTVF